MTCSCWSVQQTEELERAADHDPWSSTCSVDELLALYIKVSPVLSGRCMGSTCSVDGLLALCMKVSPVLSGRCMCSTSDLYSRLGLVLIIELSSYHG